MSFWDSVADTLGSVVDVAVNAGESVVDFVVENPGKTAAVVIGTVATGGLALAAAPAIGAAVSAAGFGVAGGTLSGAAASSAGLAALGGGSLAVGGAGVAGDTAVVTAAGGAVGASVTTAAAVVTDKLQKGA